MDGAAVFTNRLTNEYGHGKKVEELNHCSISLTLYWDEVLLDVFNHHPLNANLILTAMLSVEHDAFMRIKIKKLS